MPKLLNIGSCGLHVVHGAFYSGCCATDWNIDGILRALHYLLRTHQPEERITHL